MTLAAAVLDASGAAQGGTVLVGGGEHGAGADTAMTTLVNGLSTIAANSLVSGNGGQIVVWSNQTTTFQGSASARGGPNGGDGGQIEVSSGNLLNYSGFADAGAVVGTAGTLLLDPQNIIISSSAGATAQYSLIDPDAGQGSGFGTQIVQLSGGTIVVTKPLDKVGSAVGAGSVFFYNSATGGLISAFQGSNAGDNVASGGLVFLNYTNYENFYSYKTPTFVNDTTAAYLISSPNWNGTAGALTWVAANSTISGTLSSSNSLVGGTTGDSVGTVYNIYLLPNDNYVNISSTWSLGKGAVTFGTVAAGVTGVVSSANSLVGSTASPTNGSGLPGDEIGSGYLTQLPNGNFLIESPNWSRNAGAVTFMTETAGVTGVVNASNSFVGSTSGTYYANAYNTNGNAGTSYGFYNGDNVGGGTVYILSDGNYVLATPAWSTGKGAVTVGSETTGLVGTISSANSLVGTTSGTYFKSIYGGEAYYGADNVGSGGIIALNNGNFVVGSSGWGKNKGAATFSSDTSQVLGAVSSSNSLVGSTAGTATYGGNNSVTNSPDEIVGGDVVGGTITPVGNGNYVVVSSSWNSNVGAVTFGSGTSGITGTISSSNSLVGGTAGDYVGNGGVRVLADDDYVVTSPDWGNGEGAVTRGSGSSGVSGAISSTNSIVGTTGYNNGEGSVGGDNVGSGGVLLLANGDWVISSPNWGATKGAVTLMTEAQATSGNISASNSLAAIIQPASRRVEKMQFERAVAV